MKRVVGYALAVSMMVALGIVVSEAAAQGITIDITISNTLPAEVFDEVSKIPDRPHFVLGLEPKDDEWEQHLEMRKVFQTKDLFYGNAGSGLIDKSREDYHASGNTEMHEVITLAGKAVRILYTHHHRSPDGMYTFWSRMGEKNLAEFSPLYRKYEMRWGSGNFSDAQWKDIQRVMGWAQFEAVKEFVHEKIQGGLQKNVKDYSEMNLTDEVMLARSVLLDDPQYRDHLDDPVPGNPKLKVRDIIPIPLTRAEDFSPDLIIVGPKGFYGGFANWKTPETERIVFLDLLGLALQYIMKSDHLVAHEFVHTNPYLQGLPLSFYYDIEMWADLTTHLEGNLSDFLFHPYLAVVRDTVRTYFGYDFEEAIRRIIPEGLGVRDIREKEFRFHAAEVKRIQQELMRFIRDPKEGLMVMFYRDPYYWLAVNTKFCDTAAVWRILFALHYEPAGLFDIEKKGKDGEVISPALQTREWLMKEEEGGRIQLLAERAMKKTGEKTEFASKISKAQDAKGISKCPVHSRFFLMTESEQKNFQNIVEPLIARAEQHDVEARVLLLRIFGGSGVFSHVTALH